MRPLTSASLPMTERQALQTPAASARCATELWHDERMARTGRGPNSAELARFIVAPDSGATWAPVLTALRTALDGSANDG